MGQDNISTTLTYIVEHARELLPVRRIWLFGSRARGTENALSDIDVALEVTAESPGAWGKFAADVEEDAPTLLKIDLVDIGTCDEAMRDEIMREGRLLWPIAKP